MHGSPTSLADAASQACCASHSHSRTSTSIAMSKLHHAAGSSTEVHQLVLGQHLQSAPVPHHHAHPPAATADRPEPGRAVDEGLKGVSTKLCSSQQHGDLPSIHRPAAITGCRMLMQALWVLYVLAHCRTLCSGLMHVLRGHTMSGQRAP